MKYMRVASNKGGNANRSGGCLTSIILMMAVPIGIIIGVISVLV